MAGGLIWRFQDYTQTKERWTKIFGNCLEVVPVQESFFAVRNSLTAKPENAIDPSQESKKVGGHVDGEDRQAGQASRTHRREIASTASLLELCNK